MKKAWTCHYSRGPQGNVAPLLSFGHRPGALVVGIRWLHGIPGGANFHIPGKPVGQVLNLSYLDPELCQLLHQLPITATAAIARYCGFVRHAAKARSTKVSICVGLTYSVVRILR